MSPSALISGNPPFDEAVLRPRLHCSLGTVNATYDDKLRFHFRHRNYYETQRNIINRCYNLAAAAVVVVVCVFVVLVIINVIIMC